MDKTLIVSKLNEVKACIEVIEAELAKGEQAAA
jgi:hypothetical protein